MKRLFCWSVRCFSMLVWLWVSVTVLFAEATHAKTESPLTNGIYRVVYVVDGDTLDVAVKTTPKTPKGKIRIRVIGVDTPEVVKPNTPPQPFGREASEFTKKLVTACKNRCRVECDGESQDRYGRALAHLYFSTPRGEVLLSEELVRRGLGKALTKYPFAQEIKDRLKQAEQEAQAAHRGIWAQN